MRTRQQRALAIYDNALALGCGFKWEGADHVLVLAPTTDGAGQPHPALQSVLDRYQPELCALVPAWGVAPDRLRPATAPDDSGDKMGLIRKAVANAEKNVAKKKSYGKRQRKPPVRKPAQLPVGYYQQIIEP